MKVEGLGFAEINDPVILIINHQSLLDTGGEILMKILLNTFQDLRIEHF